MSTDDHQPEVRRVGRKDRKERLDPVESFLPSEEIAPVGGATAEDDPLAALAAEVAPGERLYFPATGRARQEAFLPEERFPPLAPDDEADRDVSAPIPATKAPRQRRGGDWRHNLVAFVFLLATLTLCGYFSVIWINPYSELNPLAPPTPFVIVTETLDPVAVAAYHADQTATAIAPPPIPTVLPSETPLAVSIPTASAASASFTLQAGGAVYRENVNDRGCNWASIEGEVLSLAGLPLEGYSVHITDAEEPERLDVSAVTFGDGRFEQYLASVPQARRYRLRLYDPANQPVSEAFIIVTEDSCTGNVADVTFIQTD